MLNSSAKRELESSLDTHDVQWINDRIRDGLKTLLKAQLFAQDVGRDAWQFSIEISTLRSLGIADAELRWLLCKQFIQHRDEITESLEQQRRFMYLGQLNLTERTCFIILQSGADYLRNLSSCTTDIDLKLMGSIAPVQVRECADLDNLMSQRMQVYVTSSQSLFLPEWDGIRHELRYLGEVVKRFKHRSPNQESVLAAFQEESWPFKIDDPLSPAGEGDPKRRLNDTIKGLNNHQCIQTLRFHGDGTGEGIIWESIRREQAG